MEKLFNFGMICAFQYEIFQMIGYGSQWYTSTMSLFAGILIAEYSILTVKRNGKLGILAVSILIFIGCGLGSKEFCSSDILKDLLTSISGVAFCIICFQTVKEIERCRLFTYVRFLEVLGDASLWGYLLHMKILFVLENHMDVTIIVYVLITCTLTIVLNEIIKYMRVIGKSDMLKL